MTLIVLSIYFYFYLKGQNVIIITEFLKIKRKMFSRVLISFIIHISLLNFQNAAQAYQTLKDYAIVNNYNYLKDSHENMNDEDFVRYLNMPKVQDSLHVKRIKYAIISNTVYQYLANDMYYTVKPWLEELLEHYGVMCYRLVI